MGRHPGPLACHHHPHPHPLGSTAQPTVLMRLEGLRLKGLALFANAPAPGRKEGQMVSEIRDPGDCSPFPPL